MFLKLKYHPIIKRRNKDVIVLFPEIPYWFSANLEILPIILYMDKGIFYDKLILKIINEYKFNANDLKELIDELTEDFIEMSVLENDDNGKTNLKNIIEPKGHIWGNQDILEIEVTNACNLRCVHCNVSAGVKYSNEINIIDIEKILHMLSNYHSVKENKRVVLTGGEIFMRPDAIDIIRLVETYGFQVLINTNALLINNRIMSALKQFEKLSISISLDGATLKTHEFIRGPNTFNRTIEIIEKLVQSNLDISISSLIHRGNFHELEALFEISKKLGVRGINPITVVRMGRAAENNLDIVPEKAFYRKLHSIIKNNISYYSLLQRSTFPNMISAFAANVKINYCGVGERGTLFIDSLGNVFPCPNTRFSNFSLGNIRKISSLDEVYDSNIIKNLQKLSVDTMNIKCSKCEIKYFCGGYCRGETFYNTGDIKSPYFRCNQYKEGIWEALWILSADSDVYEFRIKEFINSAISKS